MLMDLRRVVAPRESGEPSSTDRSFCATENRLNGAGVCSRVCWLSGPCSALYPPGYEAKRRIARESREITGSKRDSLEVSRGGFAPANGG